MNVLISDPIIQILIQTLSLEDLNNFRLAHRLIHLNGQIPVIDWDNRIQSINLLNDETFNLIKQIEQSGSKTQLFNAVKTGNLLSIKLLLVDPNEKYFNKTILMTAAKYGQVEVVKLILAAGAKVNKKGKRNLTALILAAKHNHNQIVKLLLDHQANIEQADRWDNTPLMLASDKGNHKIVELLLNAGADINKENFDEETALDIALYNEDGESFEVFKVLMTHGKKLKLDGKLYSETIKHLLSRQEQYFDPINETFFVSFIGSNVTLNSFSKLMKQQFDQILELYYTSLNIQCVNNLKRKELESLKQDLEEMTQDLEKIQINFN